MPNVHPPAAERFRIHAVGPNANCTGRQRESTWPSTHAQWDELGGTANNMHLACVNTNRPGHHKRNHWATLWLKPQSSRTAAENSDEDTHDVHLDKAGSHYNINAARASSTTMLRP